MILATVSIGKALMNTVMGMGTVFIVLIFISFIISLFTIINKRVAASETKNQTPEPTVASAVDHAISQIEQTEELSDDLELVAVITAAIAAYQGTTSTEGFQVRSIRRAASRAWK